MIISTINKRASYEKIMRLPDSTGALANHQFSSIWPKIALNGVWHVYEVIVPIRHS